MAPVSAERVGQLLQQFGEHVEHGAAVPRIDRAEAAAIVKAVHVEIDRGVEARAAQSSSLGHTVACAKGCTSCCEQAVIVFEAEAVAVARWLGAPEHADARARFVARYAAWRVHAALAPVRTAAARNDFPAVRAATVALFEQHLLCPFNHDGACDVYPARPRACREKEALDSQEPCKIGGKVKTAVFVPLDQLMQRVNRLDPALQTAMTGAPARSVVLADRVASLLGAGEVGRNDPCPCGSGKKLKKCCGAG